MCSIVACRTVESLLSHRGEELEEQEVREFCRWVEDGRMKAHGPDDPTRRVIACRTFIRNVGILSDYLAT